MQKCLKQATKNCRNVLNKLRRNVEMFKTSYVNKLCRIPLDTFQIEHILCRNVLKLKRCFMNFSLSFSRCSLCIWIFSSYSSLVSYTKPYSTNQVQHIYQNTYLSIPIYLSGCLSVGLSIYLFIYLSIYGTLCRLNF